MSGSLPISRWLLLLWLVPAALLPAQALQPPGGTERSISFGFAAAALLQFNGTRDSQLTPIASLLRLHGTFRFDSRAEVRLAAFASGGRNTLHGTPGAFVPVNDLAVYATNDNAASDGAMPRLRLGEAFFRWAPGRVSLLLGLAAPDRLDGEGVLTAAGVTDPLQGFTSGHFTRMLALGFLERERSLALPLVSCSWTIRPRLRLRAGMTFGDSGFHFFIRNTGWLELTLSVPLAARDTEVRLAVGAADADASGTHKLTPAAGILLRQPILNTLDFFIGYSRADAATAVSVLFGSYRWHFKSGIVFSPGTGSTRRHALGMGVSAVRAYAATVPEEVLEVFWKIPLADYFALTPDLQIIRHPAGSTADGRAWAVLAGLRTVLVF